MLGEASGQRVVPEGWTYRACVVDELEVGLRPLALAPLGLEEVAGFAQVVVIQGCLERGVRGFGEDTLLLQDGEDTHGLGGKGDGMVLGEATEPPERPHWYWARAWWWRRTRYHREGQEAEL